MRNKGKVSFDEWCKIYGCEYMLEEWSIEGNSISPAEVTFGGAYFAQWKCKEGHVWRASVHERSSCKSGCPYCTGRKVYLGFNDLGTFFPSLVEEWDNEKNELSIHDVTIKSTKKVWWRCKEGHQYEASIKSRTIGKTGCPYCTNKKVLRGFNDLSTIWPDIASEWYSSNDKDASEVTSGSGYKALWKCKCGQVYKARVCDRTGPQKKMCPICKKNRD